MILSHFGAAVLELAVLGVRRNRGGRARCGRSLVARCFFSLRFLDLQVRRAPGIRHGFQVVFAPPVFFFSSSSSGWDHMMGLWMLVQ